MNVVLKEVMIGWIVPVLTIVGALVDRHYKERRHK